MYCGDTLEFAVKIPLDRVSPFFCLNLGLKTKTNLYDYFQKDLEISYELLTPFLFKPFLFLKATSMVERILGIIAKQTLVEILALAFTSYMTWEKLLKFSESLKFLFLEAIGLNKRLVLD